jgi:glycosyltransferase involved in cell wall biosynthesis
MSQPLRIAQIAPIGGPVGPESGGSIDQLVWLLTEELVRRGHHVTLFATGDSQTSASLHAVYPRDYNHDDGLWDWTFHEVMHVASAFERARDFDVIHCHNYHLALPFLRLVETPVVHTYHILPNDDILRVYARYPEAHVVAISNYQRGVFACLSDVDVVYHGIDTDAFPFNPKRGDYLVFLGRVIHRKGPAEAIALAQQLGMRLVIAGLAEDEAFLRDAILRQCDGDRIQYVGPVYGKERNALLAGAMALVYPITGPEPFGLVPVEAMACGTPVAAIDRGAVPEIVENGLTGYVAPDLNGLRAAIPAALELDRTRVRQRAVERFDYRRMVSDYAAVFRRLVDERRATANGERAAHSVAGSDTQRDGSGRTVRTS